MTVKIAKASPHKAAHLLRASQALMDDLFPANSCHYLDIDALCQPDVHFYIASSNDAVVGCAALAQYDGYAEVKSMFVDPAARGTGIGDALLNQIEQTARDLKYTLLRLETGDALTAAIKMYETRGFERCGPFGNYVTDPLSTFMQKVIG